MSVGDDGWSITQVTPPAGWWVPVVTSVFALVASATAVLPRVLWSRHVTVGLNLLNVVTTVGHEAGHALASCLTGGGVWVIQVYTPDSGVTHLWHPSRLSSIVTSVAGYALPPLAGLGAATLLARGHAPMLLALTVAAMLLILVVTRDRITLASVVAIGVVAGASLYWGPVWLQQLIAYGETWLLLFGEAFGVLVITLNRVRRGFADRSDDAADLARATHIPSVVWLAAWLALSGWVLWLAIPMLWP
jgi:hypothetical protein